MGYVGTPPIPTKHAGMLLQQAGPVQWTFGRTIRQSEGVNIMARIYWCPVSGDPTHSGDFGDIPGLHIEIPPSTSRTHALLIFNLPQPYAEGTNYPGGAFRLLCDDTLLVEGCFTSSDKAPSSSGRTPLTLTAKVDLSAGVQHRAEVHWAGIRGSRVHLGGSASLAAIVE